MAYQVKCDGYPLFDMRDDELILGSPKVNLEVNTIGSGSFTIYNNHPYYNVLKKLKSVFEVSDEIGVIFRGRMTEASADFYNSKTVDLEGAMGYFNDSIVRPFNFPDDFTTDRNYITASRSGNVVEFFLDKLIAWHNEQVQEFQKFKLGKVTVKESNNYLYRTSEEYTSTWETLKSKLFDSSLGGYLCVRYEADGNYIDYLSEFESTNAQGIEFGENLLNLVRKTETETIYTAAIPIGAEVEKTSTSGETTKHTVTLSDLTYANTGSTDIVRSGDTIYSKSGVAEYGWIYAPVSETTWDDVTSASTLLTKSVAWLQKNAILPMNTMTVTAADLHFSDAEIQSLRIYQNVRVHSEPHGLSEVFPITKLEIHLAQPQNTKITVGTTSKTFTEQIDPVQKNVFKINRVVSDLKYKTDVTEKKVDEVSEDFQSKIDQFADSITLEVSGSLGSKASIILSAGDNEYTGDMDLSAVRSAFANDKTAISISAGTITFNSNTIIINSTNFSVTSTGVITAKSGTIGAITLSSTGIYSSGSSGNYAGWYKPSSITTAVKSFFAGATAADGTGAKFYVTYGGRLYATDAVITGEVETRYTKNSVTYSATLTGGGLELYYNNDLTGTISSKYYSSSTTQHGIELRVINGNYIMFVTYGDDGSNQVDYVLNVGWSSNYDERHIFQTSARFLDKVYFSGSGTYFRSLFLYENTYIKSVDSSDIVGEEMLGYSSSRVNVGSVGCATMLRGTTVYLKNTSTTVTSDRNAKNSIEALPDAYETFFDGLQPVRFKYNEGRSGRYHVGFIAQDVEQALTDAGLTSMDFAGYVDVETTDELGLAYDEFIAVLHNKIKRLEDRIAVLEKQ